MNRLPKISERHERDLKEISDDVGVNFQSLKRLLEAEKVKKLLKQRAFMQQQISNEIKDELDED